MLGSIPAPILSQEYWADLDASTFRIRGKSYNEDRIKVTATPAVFKLIAIDVSYPSLRRSVTDFKLRLMTIILYYDPSACTTDFHLKSTSNKHRGPSAQ